MYTRIPLSPLVAVLLGALASAAEPKISSIQAVSTGVANESFTISGLANREYEVRLYRTWRGRYLDAQTLTCKDGKLTVAIPELTTTQGHASHIGNDIAFKIVPR